ncbi:hypothetical protein LAZ67_6002567 [Cordylochernes scorpioides]|uniref:Transposase n=1 Tax=Cordylochernes scorpioides TaxID=51811 RepID=A0ABY6KMV3_9ARAC|nr:hypothetical protein LAZ67_6002567 [Cordylochernes scorpioides]
MRSGRERNSQKKNSFKWSKRFREVDICLEDKPRMGRPHVTDIEALRFLMIDNPQQSTCEMSARLGPSKDMINKTLHKLHKKEVRTSRSLKSERQGLQPVQGFRGDRVEKVDPLCRSGGGPSPTSKSFRQEINTIEVLKPIVKVMLSVWGNINGIVHYELVPDGRAVNADLYSEQLSRVYEVLNTRYPALINRKRVLLQHDNAPAHRDRLTTNRIKDF